jgi:hypothetical protein
MSLIHRLQLPWHPQRYHGRGRHRTFFEGWYHKIVAPGGSHAFAIIPGIAIAPDGSRQAFVQVMDGLAATTQFHSFRGEEFYAAEDRYEVQIGGNYFSADRLRLDLPELRGGLRMQALTPWPSSFLSPGIMGWYSFVPLMECYHGIVSLDHELEGELQWQGRALPMTGGRGYTEKDWGHSFPRAWVWMQSNHFGVPGSSLTLSVARIPWLGSAFTGYIAGFWHEGQLYRFTTYSGARLESLRIGEERVECVLTDRQNRLEISAKRAPGSLLKAPLKGMMEGRVSESMRASVGLRLSSGGRLIFEGEGQFAGLEVAGPVEQLTPLPARG